MANAPHLLFVLLTKFITELPAFLLVAQLVSSGMALPAFNILKHAPSTHSGTAKLV